MKTSNLLLLGAAGIAAFFLLKKTGIIPSSAQEYQVGAGSGETASEQLPSGGALPQNIYGAYLTSPNFPPYVEPQITGATQTAATLLNSSQPVSTAGLLQLLSQPYTRVSAAEIMLPGYSTAQNVMDKSKGILRTSADIPASSGLGITRVSSPVVAVNPVTPASTTKTGTVSVGSSSASAMTASSRNQAYSGTSGSTSYKVSAAHAPSAKQAAAIKGAGY